MLVIEDGTGKADAQTVATAAEVRTYATARGITVPSDDVPGNAKIEAALLDAMDYLTLKPCYKGTPSVETQALPFPRNDVEINGTTKPDNYMPPQFKTAQIRLALSSLAGIKLLPDISGNAVDYVIKEKVGPLETEYANPSQFSGETTFTAVDALLASLIGGECCDTGFLKVYRA